MKKYGYIYKFTFLPKNLIYVGKRKAVKFDNNYWGSGVMWNRIISGCNKETDIKREILEWCYSKDEINDREKYWIEKLDAMNHSIGCNVALGGDGGDLGEEVRKQISKTMKERGSQRGENNGAFGKHWFTNGVDTVFCEVCPDGYYPGTDDSINSIRNEKLRNSHRTEEQREHYRQSKLGNKNPMKLATGENHPNYGKRCYTNLDKTESGYFIPGTEPEGWTLGMRYNLKKIDNRCGKNNPAYGKHFYNNGSIQVLAHECPEGFVKGMLKKGGMSDETVD